jgi:hypothetical protein
MGNGMMVDVALFSYFYAFTCSVGVYVQQRGVRDIKDK